MDEKRIDELERRIERLEEALSSMPEPGPDMIKYKPYDSKNYLNMKELFDDLYKRTQAR